MAESSRDDTPCDQTSIAQKFPEEEDSDTNGKNLPENPYRCTVNGVQMVWVGNAWVPDVEINEDFLACYNASYGIQYDYSSIPAPETSKNQAGKETSGQDTKKLTKEEREIRKREAAERAKNWVEIEDQKNTNVYVSGLPTNITEDEFIEFMSKCGVIMNDPRTRKPKVKLYKDETGENKGDGTCCYIKMESVQLSMQILDGWNLNGNTVHVEKAQFQQKGEFDPTKKKRRLTPAQKKKFFDQQQKIFEWKPEKSRSYRPVNECTVVLKSMFTLEELDKDATKILAFKGDVEQLCSRYGVVKKVVVYDTNPEGIITVTFENVEHSDMAVKSLNNQLVRGRNISAALWDGRTKYKLDETQEERERRANAWANFLGSDGEEKDNNGEKNQGENSK